MFLNNLVLFSAGTWSLYYISKTYKWHTIYYLNKLKYQFKFQLKNVDETKIEQLKQFDKRSRGIGVLYDTDETDYLKQYLIQRKYTFIFDSTKEVQETFDCYLPGKQFPKNSVLIFRNLNYTLLIPLLTKLATYSYNENRIKVIAQTNDKQLADKMLCEVNSGVKIHNMTKFI